jgi:hypothetical protein
VPRVSVLVESSAEVSPVAGLFPAVSVPVELPLLLLLLHAATAREIIAAKIPDFKKFFFMAFDVIDDSILNINTYSQKYVTLQINK